MARERGKLVYMVYRALSYGLRRVQGLEHPLRWPKRLSRPFPRPAGPLIWFHAVSLGTGAEDGGDGDWCWASWFSTVVFPGLFIWADLLVYRHPFGGFRPVTGAANVKVMESLQFQR